MNHRKKFNSILLAISLILNSYLIYKIILVTNDNDFLNSALDNCVENNTFSAAVFQATLLQKSKSDILKIIPNITPKNFYKTKDGTEILRKSAYKFEFKNNTLQSIYIDPR